MRGLERHGGVDRDATLACHKACKDPGDRLLLRRLLTGCIISRERCFRKGMCDSPVCSFCWTHEIETPDHILHTCPAWEHLRGPSLQSLSVSPDREPCLKSCGIMMNDARIAQARTTLCFMAEPPLKPDAPQARRYESHDTDGRVAIYTDGSCSQHGQSDLRRAGYAGFWGEGHPYNFGLPLEGLAQSNQRAELAAVLRVVSQDPRMLHIHSDSMYVIRGAQRARQWINAGWRRDHADLWDRLGVLLAQNWDRVIFSHVKAHCDWDVVYEGRMSMRDKIGNAMADRMAKEGSELHEGTLTLQRAAENRKDFMKTVHADMLSILREHEGSRTEAPFLYDSVNYAVPQLHPDDMARATEG